MIWAAADITFEIINDLSDDPVVAVIIETPAGRLEIMAEVEEAGAILKLKGMHIQGSGANSVGHWNWEVIAQTVMEGWGMMDSKLQARFARLGPIRAIDRVSSGSSVVFVLRRSPQAKVPRTIDATLSLARRGIGMLKAKRMIEGLVDDNQCHVVLPAVEDSQNIINELGEAGFIAAVHDPNVKIDIRELRERLNLTREAFALQYGLEMETLRNWETQKRTPDKTATSYLRLISANPKLIADMLTPNQITAPDDEFGRMLVDRKGSIPANAKLEV